MLRSLLEFDFLSLSLSYRYSLEALIMFAIDDYTDTMPVNSKLFTTLS